MSKAQTIFTEIHTALNIANETDPLKIINVTQEATEIYQKEHLNRKENKISPFTETGKTIREYLIQQGVQPSGKNTKWTGQLNVGSFSSVAKDIEIANYRISVKENADVFINGSPVRIFVDTPKGEFGKNSKGENWFIKVAYHELNHYFLTCCKFLENSEFDTIKDFFEQTNAKTRKAFGQQVKKLHDENNPDVLLTYQTMCQKVSTASAQIFNQNLNKNKGALNAIFHFFFKINGIPYILSGTEKNNPFAILLPDSATWTQNYQFVKIEAVPLPAGQPEVMLRCQFKDKHKKEKFWVELKIEIRWSHGKFCGNPEAKVYKRWRYQDLRWAEHL